MDVQANTQDLCLQSAFERKEKMWKDFWGALQTPHIPLPPAYTEGWKLQDDQTVTRELYDTMVAMLQQMNRAVDDLPELQAVSETMQFTMSG